jgi:hypothetical protein
MSWPSTYSSKEMLLEVESVVRVLLDDFEDLERFRNNLDHLLVGG